PRLRRPLDPALHDYSCVPRALLARAPSRRRDSGDLLALRRRHVDRRVHDRLHPLMRNPLRSEAEAFRFVLVVIVGALVIIGASLINVWLGVAAAVIVVAAVVWWLMQSVETEPEPVVVSGTPAGMHRVLVLAAPGTDSVQVPDGATETLVVVPALASP